MTVSGFVDTVIFRNDDTCYTVFVLASGESRLTLVGIVPEISAGEYVRAECDRQFHPVYGEQFAINGMEKTIPQDAASIERYLGSGAIRGIGPAMAARIVAMFGEDTLRVIDEEPEALAKIKGISKNGARRIAVQFAEKHELRDAMVFLAGFGLSSKTSVKIYNEYGSSLYTVIRTNPYRMCEDVDGVGFKTADGIAAKSGISPDSDYRIRSGIMYCLALAGKDGHVCLPEDVLISDAARLLGTDSGIVALQLSNLLADRRLVAANTKGRQMVYMPETYAMERSCAMMLLELDADLDTDGPAIAERISQIGTEAGIQLDEKQKNACLCAVSNGVSVITGGPGTGKTTILNILITLFSKQNMKIELAAPTGRAAKRMSEAAGMPARTIHRMLEYSGGEESGENGGHFGRNESNPLDADIVIIDEMSMVDTYLLYALLKALRPGTRLVMVGDENQLPSVGPGNVLGDIVRSGRFHVSRLTKIFRQEEASDIVINAHIMLDGGKIDIGRKSRDFLFIRRNDAYDALGVCVALVRDKLPKYVGADISEIQVLAPMKKGVLGVGNLNRMLQKYLNPPQKGRPEQLFAQGVFREGDKVMQTKNNYDIEWSIHNTHGIVAEKGTGVFNGDIGIIREINRHAETLTVEFDEGKFVKYPWKDVEQLEPAYAITVHKSQGSEYPAVVIPLLSGPPLLMTRNVIYTAITRAKSCVCVVGSPETFTAMAQNDREQVRYSGLDDRISDMVEFYNEISNIPKLDF